MKRRYRFLHRTGDVYYWESVTPIPGDSRHELIKCSVTWFWKGGCERGSL